MTGQIIQPEEAVMSLFSLSSDDQFFTNSDKNFFINFLFLFITLYVIRFAVDNHIPRVSEALGILVGYSIVIILLLRYIDRFNNTIVKRGLIGFISEIAWLVGLILVLGV